MFFFFKFRLAAQIAEEHPSCIINAKCVQETFSATFSLLKKWKHLELQITTFPTITIQLYLWISAAAAATIGASTSTTFRTNKEAQHPKSIPPTRRLVISIFSYSRLVRLGFTEDLLIVLDNEFWFLISRNKMLVWSSPTSPQKWLQSYKSICEWKHISTLPTTCATCSASRSGHLSWSFSWKAASPPCSCFDTLSHFWY